MFSEINTRYTPLTLHHSLTSLLRSLRLSVDYCMTTHQEEVSRVFRNPHWAKQRIVECIDQLEQHPEVLEADLELFQNLLLFVESAELDRKARVLEGLEREAQRISMATSAAALSVDGNWSQRAESSFQHDSWQHILQGIDAWSNSFPAIAWVIFGGLQLFIYPFIYCSLSQPRIREKKCHFGKVRFTLFKRNWFLSFSD